MGRRPQAAALSLVAAVNPRSSPDALVVWNPSAASSRPRTKVGKTPDSVLIDHLERVEKANCLVFGERDAALIGKHISCTTGCGAPKEIAQ
jgi:hypothetical protein